MERAGSKKNKPALGRKKSSVAPKERRIVHWDSKYVPIAFELALLGHKDAEIARVIGVTQKLFSNWQDRYPELTQALQDGRDLADAKVARSLYERALGYSHPDVHISAYQGDITVTSITKYYPPDTAAAVAWLRNRQKERWGSDAAQLHTNLSLHANINLRNLSTEDLENAEKEGMKKLLGKARDNSPSSLN